MTDPVISAEISTGATPLELNGDTYELERGALEEIAVSWRKQTVDNTWVEGTFVINAVKENVVLPLNVWVSAETQIALRDAVTALTDALSQLSFTLAIDIDGAVTTWTCQVADYRVTQQQAFLFAKQALVQASVPAFPTPVLT